MRVTKHKKLAMAIRTMAAFAALVAIAVPMLRASIVRADAINDTDFVFTVDTTKAGSANTQFVIPVRGTGYNYTVDCNNDGTVDASGQTGSYTCTYATPGTYTIRIGGAFPEIYFNNGGDKLKMISVDQWGTGKWRSFSAAFYGAENMDVTATDTPDLSGVTSLFAMFQNNYTLKGENANWNWNTATITNTTNTFSGARLFNQNIGSWNMSSVTTMGGMFNGATTFNNGGSDSIKNWDTSKVNAMNSMFFQATSFNQPIGAWDVSKVVLMRLMFSDASSFDQSLADWRLDSLVTTTGQPTSAYSGATGMLNGTALSIENYDETLDSWNAQSLQSPVELGAAGLKYCLASDARANMVESTANGGRGWTITGDSKDCPAHTLSFDTNGGSAVANQSIAYGDSFVAPTAPTRSGYEFAGWYSDASFANAWDFDSYIMPNSDLTLYARWTAAAVTPATPTSPATPAEQPDSGSVEDGLADTGINMVAAVMTAVAVVAVGAATLKYLVFAKR